jgi:hypothetical protein
MWVKVQTEDLLAPDEELATLVRRKAMAKRSEFEETLFQKAKEQHEESGELEFDDDAVVSLGWKPGKGETGGGYLMAWCWVEADEYGGEDE